MSSEIHVLDCRVVGVLVRHEEGRLDVASIRVLPLPIEDFVVKIDVRHVDGIVESHRHHLRYSLGVQIPRHRRAIRGTEAFWYLTDLRIANGCSIWIIVDI